MFIVLCHVTNIILANDLLDVYGRINVTFQDTSDSQLNDYEFKSNASRIGLKGKRKFSESFGFFYQFEWGFDASSRDSLSDKNINDRDQYVGFGSQLGKIIIGRKSIPIRSLGTGVDLFNDQEADIKKIMHGEKRVSDQLAYSSPEFRGFSINAMFTKDTPVDDNGYSYAIKYKKNKLRVAYAQAYQIEGLQARTHRLAMQYELEKWGLGAIYNTHKKWINNGQQMQEYIDEESFVLSVLYQRNSDYFKLQIGEGDERALKNNNFGDKGMNQKLLSLGWDHKFNKHMKLFAYYSRNFEDDITSEQVVDEHWLAIGYEHRFQ